MLNVHEPLLIYMDKRKALQRIRPLFLWLSPFWALIFILMCLTPPHDFLTVLSSLLFVAELPFFYFLFARSLKRQSKSIVSLSSQGITIDTQCSRVGFLHWDEIEDVYAYKLIHRMIGVTLKDPKSVFGRIGLKRSFMIRMKKLDILMFKPFGVRVAPINILQQYLPMSADELLLQIQAYRNTYA